MNSFAVQLALDLTDRVAQSLVHKPTDSVNSSDNRANLKNKQKHCLLTTRDDLTDWIKTYLSQEVVQRLVFVRVGDGERRKVVLEA